MIDLIARNAPVIGLLFFFIFFCGLLAWIYRPGSKQTYISNGNIPLKEDKPND